MAHTAALPSPRLGARVPVTRAFRPAVLASMAAAVIGCVLAVAAWPIVGGLLRSPQLPLATALAMPSQTDSAFAEPSATGGKSRARARCDSCGVIETIRRFESTGKLPGGYELTVRLRDGSTRVSSDAGRGKWHIGDSIMFIGGAKPSAN